jgi:hypothetical protein
MTIDSMPVRPSDVSFGKAGVGHPVAAIGAGIVEAGIRLDQHDQNHQQTRNIPASIIVDEVFIHNQRPALRQGIEGLRQELAFVSRFQS